MVSLVPLSGAAVGLLSFGGFGLAIMALSAGLLCLNLAPLWRARKLRQYGIAVPGTLAAPAGSRRRGVRVHFHTREGKEMVVRHNLVNPTRIPAREVTVYYDPNKPQRLHASGLGDSLSFEGWAAIPVCLLFFLVGLGLVTVAVLNIPG